MTTTATPIKPAIGVEITGLSGDQLIDPQVAADCRAALETYGVVVYRNADLDDHHLVGFSRLLGEVVIGAVGGEADHPEVTAITLDPQKSTLAAYRAGTFYWHIDGVNDAIPQKATLLAAHEVAASGGGTEFANTYAAYDALSPTEQAELEGMKVVHSIAASQRLVYPEPTEKQLAAWAKVPSREHPLVWTRPNGRKSLLVGATADYVVGLDEEASTDLLRRLLEWSTTSDHTLCHEWRKGDLVVWDNTGILHRAQPYTADSPRLLHRTTLVGELTVA